MAPVSEPAEAFLIAAGLAGLPETLRGDSAFHQGLTFGVRRETITAGDTEDGNPNPRRWTGSIPGRQSAGGFVSCLIQSGSVAPLVASFSDAADGQALKSRELILMLLQATPEPFSRRQFTPGHITCTGLVQAPDGIRLLLVHHRRLDRWLLPGGHVEADDPEIWDTARREVVEETGVLLASGNPPPLAGLDVHGIPAGKGEPYHLHHDILFRFQALEEEFRLSHESRAIAWCSPDEFERYDVPGNVRRAWARMR